MIARCGTFVLAAILVAGLAGCGTADHYSSRAEIMNVETSTSRNKQILLNIMRAAYREPLQFTDTSTITGTASVGASIGSALPVAGARGTGASLFSLMPGATVSEGPTFSVANQNTLEFFQGIQTPIGISAIANYFRSSTDPSNLLALVISEVRLTKQREIVVINNTFKAEASYKFFRSVIDDLLRSGLSIELVDVPERIGPVLSSTQASDPVLLAGLARAYGQAQSPSSVPRLQGTKDANGRSSKMTFDLSRTAKSPQFCFKYSLSAKYPSVDVDIVDSGISKYGKKINLGYHIKSPISDFSDEVPPNRICGVGVARSQASMANAAVFKLTDRIDITPRSVEQIIYFLGDMVRNELGLEDGIKKDLLVANAESKRVELFHVREHANSESDVTIAFHERNFSVWNDPSGIDGSMEVIQLLTELIALQSSAKSYPTPNIIAVSAP